MPKVTIVSGESITVDAFLGQTLSEVMSANHTYHDSPCGGKQKCKKCLIEAYGSLSPREETEYGLPENIRLACVARVLGDCEIRPAAKQVMETERSTKKVFVLPDRGKGYTVGCDIGTTTVVTYLLDSATGEKAAIRGESNLQRSYGSDVISRIDASRCPADFNNLHKVIVEQIERMTLSMLDEVGETPESVSLFAIAGNTTMQLLFAGISPEPLGAFPFPAPTLFGEDIISPFHAFPNVRCYLLSCADSFVGGDITGAILACGLYRTDACSMLLDIGTNGEMALGNNQQILVCATAAGPAFEGADISCGMASLPGAIHEVQWIDGKLQYSFIGKDKGVQKPVGICGSGLIDALAVLLAIGAVDETGRLLPPEEAPEELQDYLEENEDEEILFRLLPSDITIHEKDIRKLQLAKASIRAGMETLLLQEEFRHRPPERLYIAGGFGSHIRLSSAVAIGMLPEKLAACAVSIGNGAGEGAAMVALSSAAEADCKEIDKLYRYLDLSTNPDWNDLFIEHMSFEE